MMDVRIYWTLPQMQCVDREEEFLAKEKRETQVSNRQETWTALADLR